MMQFLTTSILFSFGLGMSLGVGAIQMIKNGINNGAKHTVVTGLGLNIIDVVMMTLYYFGLSKVFSIPFVEICLWIVGIGLLGSIAFSNIKNAHKSVDLNKEVEEKKLSHSLKDGVLIALLPSSLVFWVATMGSILNDAIASNFTFILACSGILIGFIISNFVWASIIAVANKLMNGKMIYWINIISGVILFGFVAYFIYQLYLSILAL